MKLKNKQTRSLWYKKIFFYLKSGQSLAESARTAATDIDTRYIFEELQDGSRFSDAVSVSVLRGAFTKTEISLLKVAEQTGTMQSACETLSAMLKDQYRQSQRLIGALIYPVLVLIMAMLLLLMILTVIVPKIGPLFSSMSSVPITTQVLIASSKHIVDFWYVDLMVVLVLFAISYVVKKRTKYVLVFQKYAERIWVYIPYLKDVYVYWYIERWIQVVYVSLQSGASLVQSLEFGHQSVENTSMQIELAKVTDAVREGNTCSGALQNIDTVLRKKLSDWSSVIASGEKTGTLKEVFAVSHEHIDENLKEAFDRFQKAVEPALIVLVGIMVLFICLSIVLPMYQLTQSLQ